ncbi:MAG: hypothetical protein ACTSVY_07530 [Candidatus Helarchaeota archaeon]
MAEGLNPKGALEEIEESELGNNAKILRDELKDSDLEKKERKNLEKQLKKIEKNLKGQRDEILFRADMIARVFFKLDDVIKKMRVDSDWHFTSKFFSEFVTFTCIVDFEIPEAFLFGRVNKKIQHGKGVKGFVPLNLKLLKEFEKDQDDLSDELINKYLLLFSNMTRTRDILDQLKSKYENLKKKIPLGNEFIDALNSNKQLLNDLKLVHFGESVSVQYRMQSDVDLSIIGVPRLGKSILFVKTHDTFSIEKPLKAAYALASALKEISN